MGLRVLKVSLEVLESLLRHGITDAKPTNVPSDIRVLDARLAPTATTLDLLVESTEFDGPPPDDRWSAPGWAAQFRI